MEILIEPVINGKSHGVAIQAKKFTLQLLLKNLSSKPSSEFKINNVWFKSAEGKDINNNCDDKSFVVKSLNPSEEYILDLGEYGHPSHGLLSITLKATSEAGEVTFYQKDPYTKNQSELKQKNTWEDFFLIESTNEIQQRRSNEVMIRLNWILLFLTTMQVLKMLEDEIRTFLNTLNKGLGDADIEFFIVLISLLITIMTNKLFFDELRKTSKGGK